MFATFLYQVVTRDILEKDETTSFTGHKTAAVAGKESFRHLIKWMLGGEYKEEQNDNVTVEKQEEVEVSVS